MPVPISLIIDDPAPLINVFFWHAADAQKTDRPVLKTGEPVARDVPVGFMREFAGVIERHGIRGKFSVLPYPAGLGKIGEGWPGCDRRALSEWIDIACERVMPLMDICPEILTHAKALDLATMTLLQENERDWAAHQNAATLTPYIATALRWLNEVGLEATGVTSPWDFGREVEPAYQRAVFDAMRQVNGRTRTWYFLHANFEGTRPLSSVVLREGDGWLVSIVSQGNDFAWQTMDTLEAGEEYVRSIADLWVTPDGHSGRLAELYHAGTPVVFHTHWQSLYSNGRRTGLRVLDEVGRRVASAWGTGAEWTKCSDLAELVAAMDEGQGR
jgi:hypothetical protein